MSDPAVQPHGVLLALDAEHRVVAASTNVKDLVGAGSDDAVGRPLAELLGPAAAVAIELRVAQDADGTDDTDSDPLLLVLDGLPPGAGFAGRQVEVRHHHARSRLVVELEPAGADGARLLTYASARGSMTRLAQAQTVRELAGRLAVEIRALLGFDRVLVYRLDDEHNGTAIAEDRRSDLDPFPGPHEQALDLPVQAGGLIQLVADVEKAPVALHPALDPETEAPLDLSHATLRSISPADLEHLSRQGVTASMSIPLHVDGRLWGLVACHHHSGPHRPNHGARAAAGLLAGIAGQVAADRERADARERALVVQSVLARMTARLAADPASPLRSLMDDPELLTLVNATGAALCYDGDVTTCGTVVGEVRLRAIADALRDPDRDVTYTDRIGTLVPSLCDVPEVAGALRVRLAHDGWLLWVRPEQERVVDWGGPASPAQVPTGDGRQVVRGRSAPWAPWKVEIADSLGDFLIGLLLTRSRDQIAMAESVQRSVVLDQPPAIRGVRLAARYRPASTYQLGGDWWDAFELPDGGVAFVVGDVAGHGVSAASTMTQVRTALRAYLFEGHSPASCLDRLDRLMASLLGERIATAVVGVLDRDRRRVELASAGHPPPFLLVGDRAVDLEVPVRPLLGVGAGHAEGITLALPPGATLLLYTDGLVERRGTDLLAQTERLREVAAATHADDDLESWVDQLLRRHAHGDIGTDDDTTVLAIRADVRSVPHPRT